MGDQSRRAFADVVGYHLSKLGWKRGDLCDAARVSDSQLSGWLNGKRPLGRDHVNRIVWALGLGYRDTNISQLDALDALLNELLVLAGFSAVRGTNDFLWHQLKSKASAGQPLVERSELRVLRVGWVDYPCFSYRASGKGDPEGLAAAIMARVARLIGAVPNWIECKWGDIFSKLQDREIDVAAPIIMVLPSRLFQAQFTKPIPGIGLGINGVLNREYRSMGQKQREFSPVFVRGEVGEELCTLLIPGVKDLKDCASLDEARKLVLNSPLNGDRVRCLVADHMVCKNLAEQHSDLELLNPAAAQSQIQLPVAMAVHEGEPRLLSLLDSCVRLLETSSFFTRLYHDSPDAFTLKRLGVLTE